MEDPPPPAGTAAPTTRRKWLRGGLQTSALLAAGAAAGGGGLALHHWLTGRPGGGAGGASTGVATDAVTGKAMSSDSPRAPSPEAALASLWASVFKDLEGRAVNLSAFKGRPLVVNFWASWCGPCLEEMPDFQRASQTVEGKRAQFVGIGIDSAEKMKPFAGKMGISYLLLEGGAQGLDLVRTAGNSAGALPFTLILDRSGAVALRKLGKMTYAELIAALTLL